MRFRRTLLARWLDVVLRRPVHLFKTQAALAYITFRATLETGQGERTRFSGVAYSGGVVPSYGWIGDIAIDLSGLRNDGALVPVLSDHGDTIDAIAGIGRIYRTTGADGITQLAIEGELYDTEAGNKIARLLQEGFPMQTSRRAIGARRNTRRTSTATRSCARWAGTNWTPRHRGPAAGADRVLTSAAAALIGHNLRVSDLEPPMRMERKIATRQAPPKYTHATEGHTNIMTEETKNSGSEMCSR